MSAEDIGQSWFIVCQHLIDGAKRHSQHNQHWNRVCSERGETQGYVCDDCIKTDPDVAVLQPLARESVEMMLRGAH